MGDLVSGAVEGIGNLAGQIFSQEALPVTLPLAGAAIGGGIAGGKGALEGAGAGALAGQLVGTGPLAFFGPGDQSVIGSIFDSGAPTPTGGGGTAPSVGTGGGGVSVPAGSAAPAAAGPSPAAATFTPDVTDTLNRSAFATATNGLDTFTGAPPLDTGGTSVPVTPTAATGTGTGPQPSSVEKFFSDPTAGNALNILKANPNLALAAGGLGLSALQGNKQSSQEAQLQRQAGQFLNTGTQLTQPLLTGQLPPGAAATVRDMVQKNQAAIRQNFANMGLSGSTEEQTALAQAAQQGEIVTFQIAQQMAQLGLGESQSGSQILSELGKESLASDQALQDAIVKFASMAAGGGTQLNLKLAPTA